MTMIDSKQASRKISWLGWLLAAGRGGLCGLCGLCGLGVMLPLSAASPEGMPSYAESESLREDASLQAVAFADRQVGIAVGDRGVILRTEDGGVTWRGQQSRVDCRLCDVVWLDSQRVLVVGGGYDRITQISRGAVLFSSDAGRHWQRAEDQELSRLRRIERREDGSLLAVGDWSYASMTREFESHDSGRTWTSAGQVHRAAGRSPRPSSKELYKWSRAAGVPVVVRDACRASSELLVAVGDHGVILRSTDGGKQWAVQRGQERQTSILVVAETAESVAWPLIGSEALEHRNRVALLIHRDRNPDHPHSTDLELANQATVMLGGSGADLIADQAGFESTTGLLKSSPAAMEWIAIHRPVVVVLDPRLPAEVHDAFFQAATAAGVRRIASVAPGQGQSTTLHRNALLPKTGVLASDMAADAMHWVSPHRGDVDSISLRYLYDAANSRQGGDSLTSGLPLPAGRFLAARHSPASRRQLQIAQARMNQSRRLSQLLDATGESFATSLRAMLDQTAKTDQFRLAWTILQTTHSRSIGAGPAASHGVELHRRVLAEIESRYADTSAGKWAALRRDSIAHSREWARLNSALQRLVQQRPAPLTTTTSVAVSPFQDPDDVIQQVSSVSPLVVPTPEKIDLNATEKPQSEVDLAWEFHPAVLVAREASKRRNDSDQLQLAEPASANYQRLIESAPDAWSRLLAESKPSAGDPYRGTALYAHAATAPPRLDGKLDDPCWATMSTAEGRSSQLRMAYDQEYVYVAVVCPSDTVGEDATGSQAAASIRDHDLSAVDRLRLCFDIDQDLLTAMQLQMTDHGRTHDAIDDNPRWQPTWYVDSHRTDRTITFELAILRRDLVELPILPGQSWFVSMQPLAAKSVSETGLMPNPSDWQRVIFQ